MIHAFEQFLTDERGRTTRQEVDRVGVVQILTDFATSKKPTQSFEMLMERKMPELTGEAIVLRHADGFRTEVVAAAEGRLASAGATGHPQNQP